MNVAEYIVEFLIKQKTRDVFLVTGGAIANVVDALGRRHDAHGDIRYVCVQHEQAAAMAVEAYSRLHEGIGVAMATSGPGATNFITGMCGLWFDSIPGLFLTGQVSTREDQQSVSTLPRQVGFQETDIVSMVKPITKFAVQVRDASQIRAVLEEAVWHATHGRPGPVLVDIPVDVQTAMIDPETLAPFLPPAAGVVPLQIHGDELSIIAEQIAQDLAAAQRPVLLLGGGVRLADATAIAAAVVDTLDIPVVVSWSGFDILPADHPLCVGALGVYGNRGANFAVQNADVLLVVGSRLDTRQTGGMVHTFARHAKKIVVDIDAEELGKNRGLTPDQAVCADAKEFLIALQAFASLVHATTGSRSAWMERARHWKTAYPALPTDVVTEPLSAYVCADAITRHAPTPATIIIDEGGNLVWGMQTWQVKVGQRVFSSFGNSPMGYALPAAIGAAIARDKKEPVVCIDGDGGFQMNIQELQTVVYEQLPIKIFLLNNRSMGIIKQFQDLAFASRRYAVDAGSGYSAPDFVRVAEAYGLPAVRVTTHADLDRVVAQVFATPGPILCDIWVDEMQQLQPKLEFGKPIEDMAPYLSDEELAQNMIVPQLPRETRQRGWINLKQI